MKHLERPGARWRRIAHIPGNFCFARTSAGGPLPAVKKGKVRLSGRPRTGADSTEKTAAKSGP